MRHLIACILLMLAGISPVFGGTPMVTNLTSQSFTVSWTTAAAETGWVEYGTTADLGSVKYDNRGQKTVDDTHYVTIEGLSGTTTYYYRLVSGGVGSMMSTTTTAPIIAQPTPNETIVIGNTCLQGTTIPAEGAIVYAKIRTSSGTESGTLSTINRENEPWFIYLGKFLSLDGCNHFPYSSGDTVIVKVDAAGDGMATATATITTGTNIIISVGTITLVDMSAPPDTPVFQPSPQNGRISLNWDMPAISSGVSGILILRSQQGYPQATPTAGISYAVGSNTSDAVVVCAATNTTAWTDGTLTNNTTYYYRIFTYDGAYNYSPGIVCQATPVVNLDNAAIYPNPWRTGEGAVSFDKLEANTHICIYNIAGELVLEAEAPSGTYSWLPKNIASGIYVYLLKSDNGCVRTGKLGIVR